MQWIPHDMKKQYHFLILRVTQAEIYRVNKQLSLKQERTGLCTNNSLHKNFMFNLHYFLYFGLFLRHFPVKTTVNYF